ncbi:hypothetical protein [Shewanella sp. MBTL60-007]|uniref:hypothetical protein n=1 Tax=Shewanella sp. MBTL60-007 TaxID=2815911 RepID=UPI001BC2B515|nr:hypothetical protein [Shewanella sp. MBTL60-007]GIU31560.1 hypothetical protein TUM3792_43400 [Shewanella sp. MBTL60-007]
MKKAVMCSIILAAAQMVISSQAVAHGGSGGSLGGNPVLDKGQLEAKWNGKAGPQSTPISGIIAHWNADACGTLNGKQFDPKKCAAIKVK